MSLLLLDDIGVTEKSLLEIVQKVSVEQEIADWLRRNADLSSVASLNENFSAHELRMCLPSFRQQLSMKSTRLQKG